MAKKSNSARVFQALALGLAATALAFSTLSALAAEPKRILILHSFGAHFAPFSYFSADFRTDLALQSRQPLDVYESSLEMARFPSNGSEARFTDYLAAMFAQRPLDLVVAVGGPAVKFVQKHRNSVFQSTPVLLTAVEMRVVDQSALTENDAVVAVNLSPLATVQEILEILPDTTNVFVAIGNTPLERYWADEIKSEFAPLEGRIKFDFWGTVPFDEMLKRSAALPPHSAIFYTDIWVDAAGVPLEEDTALSRLHATANAPIFGLYDAQVGKGPVGGTVLPIGAVTQRAAAVAGQILAGERPGDIKTPPFDQSLSLFDARELNRWKIDPSRLPSGSIIGFREPSLWEEHRTAILVAGAIIAIQGLLIVALLANRRGLRQAELRRRKAEEEALDLSGRLINSQEEERERLARELHDDVTQRIAMLAIDAGRGENEMRASAVGKSMRGLREGLVRLSEDVHALSYRLHPSILADLGLVEALRAECERLEQLESVELRIDADEVPADLPYPTTLCLFRVAQEALRNVVRHSAASEVTVAVRRWGGGLQLVVTDNGSGFDPSRRRERPSLGHASMRQRIRLLAGELDIHSAPGRGTTVLAWVPVEEKPYEAAAGVAG